MIRKRDTDRRNGFTLVELITVLAILTILILMAAPQIKLYTQAAERAASEMEAVEVAHAVKRYLQDKQEAGELDAKAVRVLINLELDRQGNALEDYIGGGMEGARIESIYINLNTCTLNQLTYVNQVDRVRVSYDSEGRQKVAHVDSGI